MQEESFQTSQPSTHDSLELPSKGKSWSAGVNLTESAIARIQELRKQKNNDKIALYLSVRGGGCSGFTYIIKFTTDKKDLKDVDLKCYIKHNSGGEVHLTTDKVLTIKGDIICSIDAKTENWLNGATVDFVNDLTGSNFMIKNPNSKSGCGCGISFAVK